MLLVCIALYAVFAFYGDDSNADVAMEASSVVKAGNSCKVYQRKCIVLYYVPLPQTEGF